MATNNYDETFNTADSTTLGPVLGWNEWAGDMQVVSNAARAVSANTVCIANHDFVSVPIYRAVVTVKTFTTPSSGTNWVFAGTGGSNFPFTGGIRLSIASTGVCTIESGSYQSGAWTISGTATTITKPTAPFTLESQSSGIGVGPNRGLINGAVVHTAANSNAGGTAQPAFGLFAQNTVAEVEVDAVHFDNGQLPLGVTSFRWPIDGIGYSGPFISSAGNVYVVGITPGAGAAFQPGVWKATDPTVSFTALSLTLAGATFGTNVFTSLSATQVGDVLHIISCTSSNTNLYYVTVNMATDTATSVVTVTGGGGVNGGCAVAKRSTGGDVIVFYNAPGVVSMSKTYGRIAAKRIVAGTTPDTTATPIGIALLATTAQPESIDSVCLGSSDRVHLFWFQGNAATLTPGTVFGRCVKSTDNLNGTAPATAATTVTASNNSSSVEQTTHASGQSFKSSGNLLAVPTLSAGGSGAHDMSTATDADSPSWAAQVQAGSLQIISPFGATSWCGRFGGAPFDGTDAYTVWLDNSSADPKYNKNSGSGWSSGSTAVTIATVTATQVSSNIFQRGTNMVLALVYDVSSNSFAYDEIVLRTVTGPANLALSPATITAQPQALTRTAGGIALTLTNASLAATAQPLTITNLPPPANLPLSPASITAQAQALTRTAGGIAPVLTAASISATAQPLTLALGGIALVLSPGSVQLQAQPLTVVISQQLPLSPATVTAQAQPLTRTAGAVSVVLSPATVTAQAQTLTPTPGAVSVALALAVVTATPQPLSITAGAPGGTSLSLPVASVSLQAQPLALTPGPASATLSAALLTAQPQPLTATFGATAIALTPATAALQAQPLAITLGPPPLTLALGFASVAFQAQPLSAAYAVARPLSFASVTTQPQALTATHAATLPLSAANSTVQPQPLTLTVGGVALALTPASVQTQAQPLGLSVGGALALAAASISVQPQPLTRTVGGIAVALSPASATVQAQPLTLVVAAPNALALSPATITFQPQSLTRTTTVAPVLSPATVTLTAQTLTLTLGGISVTLTAASVTAQPQTLIISAGLQVVPALLTVQAQPLTVTAAVAKPIGTATLQAVAQTLALTQGAPPTFITLSSVTVTLQARPLTRTVGGAAITLIPVSVAVQAVQLGIATDFHMKMGYILRHPYTNLSAQHRWTVGEPSHRYESLPV